MRWWILTFILFLTGQIASAQIPERILLIGDQITAEIAIESDFIFTGSDTLRLNGILLVRSTDYSFQPGQGKFKLLIDGFKPDDSLEITYQPLPAWLKRSYGRDLPEIVPSGNPPSQSDLSEKLMSHPSSGNGISLTGSKSFRFSARSSGASEFGQSLDLHLSGELSPGVELSGTVSDRGYNPTYGTANSRLEELDKLNLKLKSPRLLAQIGDINLPTENPGSFGKSVSGAAFKLEFPAWNVQAAAARPKGEYRTESFTGQDGFQGPYQLGQNRAGPVVPGSESVWLDGRRLERGVAKDYVIDYPLGRITFSTLNPIDRRSRIEVDYEPQSTDYKKELFSVGGGGQLNDSALFISLSALREGDDKGQPLIGELSDSDRQLLSESGDASAIRSGVRFDSGGTYILDTLSLPDTVWQYVGQAAGEYDITFSFVGAGKGDYRFLGEGRYQFVGVDQAEYLPIVILPAAARHDYVRSIIGTRNNLTGLVTLDYRTTRFDQNLFSSLDDNDNEAEFYRFGLDRQWNWHEQTSRLRFVRQYTQSGFVSRERLNRADFSRNYFLPVGFTVSRDETLNEAQADLWLLSGLLIQPTAGYLDYRNKFEATRLGLGTEIRPLKTWRLKGSISDLQSTLQQSDSLDDGKVRTYTAGLAIEPVSSLKLSSDYEHDQREHEYTDSLQGTRYSRVVSRVRYSANRDDVETISHELWVEDSLDHNWIRTLTRNRLSATSRRRIGPLNYDANVTFDWSEREQINESSVLGRAAFRYNSNRHGLQVNNSYLVSTERRNARGIAYLEVEPGFGNYIKVGDSYIPDEDGNYVEVEEILSDAARVRRGERSFFLSKRWSQALVRVTSDIEEELKEGGERKLWWLVPFLSDADQPYLFLSRRREADLKAFQIQNSYAFNLKLSEQAEIREINSTARKSQNLRTELTLRQPIKKTFVEESCELFRSDRDDYFSGSGNIDGFQVALNVRQMFGQGEIGIGGRYRRADSEAGENSRISAVNSSVRSRLFARGEFRARVELYRQTFDNLTGVPSFQLTGNLSGEKGATWSISLRYGIAGSTRLNFSLNGRHSDDRAGRVTGKGELVASI